MKSIKLNRLSHEIMIDHLSDFLQCYEILYEVLFENEKLRNSLRVILKKIKKIYLYLKKN